MASVSEFIKNMREVQNAFSGFGQVLGAMFSNKKDQSSQPAQEQPAQEQNKQETPPQQQQDDDSIEYTYKSGDTFGQVISDLGLKSDKGLWGSDGDVAYYTKQLQDQGIYGNIPAGTKIKLKRRTPSQQPTQPTQEQSEKSPSQKLIDYEMSKSQLN